MALVAYGVLAALIAGAGSSAARGPTQQEVLAASLLEDEARGAHVVLLQLPPPHTRLGPQVKLAQGSKEDLEARALLESSPSSSSSAPLQPVSLVATGWHRWSPPPTLRRRGYQEFFYSAELYDWCLFSLFIFAILVFRVTLLNWLAAVHHRSTGLFISLAAATCYFLAVWSQLGHQSGKDWLAGYVMELTFMVENIFIFSLIIHGLKVEPAQIPKCLLCVVIGQIAFELIFSMGLAAWLRSITFLPYVLGIWLVCCGLSCFFEGQHSQDESNEDTLMMRSLRTLFGDRVVRPQVKGEVDTATHNQRDQEAFFVCLVVALLLLADFFLEIDVVLMKIETFRNGYIAFTSSAMAVVALPELYFVGEAMLHKYAYLQRGIAMILIIFGLQLVLCNRLHVTLPPLMGCLLIALVLTGSIAASALKTRCLGKSSAA